MRGISTGALGGAVLVAAVAAASPAALAQDGEAPPIVNGETTSDWEAVGALLACDSQYCSQYCSATLAAEQWIVTAGHCIAAADQYDRYGYDNYFGVGRSVNNITVYDVLTEWHTHPRYDSSNNDLSHDIGVAKMQTGLPGVDPMPLNSSILTNAWVGKELTYVGYGITGDGKNDSGTKRYAEMPIYDYDSNLIYALDLADDQNLCSGDSGGAALESVDGGYELVGVNSFVFAWEYSDRACDGGGNGVVRVDAHLDFIEQYFTPEGETDTDTDTDADTDTDTDADADTDTDTEADDAPDRPDEDDDSVGGDDEDFDLLGTCATAPAPAGLALALVGLAALGRRRED